MPGPLPLLAITGPTAVGKSALALDLAERLGAEIVSCDSRQVYRPLTIGTAKPAPSDLARVRHHLIDELDLGDEFSAGRFAAVARDRTQKLHASGRRAIVVGGSTLYLHALVHGLSDVPPTSAETRRRLTERLDAEGAESLYAELQRVDAASAETMDPSKTQRLVRALEVFHDTGRPLSSYHERSASPPFKSRVLVLHRDRKELYDRINRRVDVMLEGGLLEENRELLEAGHPPDLNPLRTIGYREPMAHLRGEIDFDEMVTSLKQNTRRYAKRQLTWFRRREEYEWIDLDETSERGAVERILAMTD